MRHEGISRPSGALALTLIPGVGPAEPVVRELPPHAIVRDPGLIQIAANVLPHRGLTPYARDWRMRNLPRMLKQVGQLQTARAAQRVHGMVFGYGALWLQVHRGDGTVDDLGLASLRVITSAGVNYLTADMAGGASDINLFKFHAFGTGVGAEAAGDTALGTELTTQYNPDNTRPTGSQSSSTNTYTTAATFTPDSGGVIAVTEHGIFTQAATGGGTLWDRSQFAAVNTNSANGDSILATYVATFPSGG